MMYLYHITQWIFGSDIMHGRILCVYDNPLDYTGHVVICCWQFMVITFVLLTFSA